MKKLLLFIILYFSFLSYTYSYELKVKWVTGMNGECQWNGGQIFKDGESVYATETLGDLRNEVQKYFSWDGYSFNEIIVRVSSCAGIFAYNVTLPDPIEELEGTVIFQNLSNGTTISTYKGVVFGSPVEAGIYGESVANNFINENIKVTLVCNNCESPQIDSVIINENGEGNLSITENGQTLTKKFHVWKINKTPPTGTLSYSPNNNIWTNGSKTVILNGGATIFGSETWNRDWLIGNSNPSFTCNIEGGCSGSLFLKDSAGNTFTENFQIKNIDKSNPTIHIETYEIIGSKQKVGIRCEDTGGSGCEYENEQFEEISVGITTNKCVSDNAGNTTCMSITTDNSNIDYSDSSLAWTNLNRRISLNCSDDIGGSGCAELRTSKIISENINKEALTIRDNAGNTFTKNFQISKIDKILPTILISSPFPNIDLNPFKIKASNIAKIKINAEDNLSGISEIKYKWNSTCKIGTSIIGETIVDNDNINYKVSGIHTLYVCAKDNAGNIKQLSKEITIFPGDLDELQSSVLVDSTGDKYANSSDEYTYTLALKDEYNNPIYSKDISLTNLDTLLKLDEVNNSGNSALITTITNLTTDTDGEVNFTVKSYTPGDFEQKFEIKMKKWGNDYVDNSYNQTIFLENGENSFKKPISGSISVEGGDIPEIGKDQKYEINLTNPGSVEFSNGKLSISESTIINTISGHFWKTFDLINSNFGNNISANLGFSGSIDADDNILEGVKLSTDELGISYKLNGKEIKYYLDDFELSNSCSLETLGVKVYGGIQGDGKSEITGQEENFSNVSKGKLRSIIRKNGYQLIRGMSNGDTVNGVKYVEGNITISGNNLGYETLIVKNGNVIIDGNLNTDNSKLGIIVLKDSYLIESDYNNVGNIYVNKDVETINAIIYADGVFRSAKSNGTSYSDEELDKQLKLNGSLFTRNTIGGSISAGGHYLLPGGQETTNFDLAEIYDLNNIRKVPLDCNGTSDNYSFIIKYNSSIQNNPPKGF